MSRWTWTRKFVAAALPLAALAGVAAAARSHPGSLDTSFARHGSATLGSGTRLFGAALQRDGKLVAVGESGAGKKTRLLLARFTSAGSLDRTFGHGGLVQGPDVHTTKSVATLGRAVAIQADGKIIVVGKATSPDGSGRAGLLIERFRANGSLDSGFGSRGVVNLMSASFGDGYAVFVQSNGKIIATGSEDEAGSGNGVYPRAAIVRLSANGHLDNGFGHGGIDVIDLGAYSYALAVAAGPGGKVVIAGSQSPDLQATNGLIARLTPGGTLDRSFHGIGSFAHQYARRPGAYSAFSALAVQPGGTIVAAGSATAASGTADAILARFTAAGSQASVTYVQSAKRWTETGNIVPGATGVAIARNRDIIASGQFLDSALGSATLWAFKPGGAPDRSFGAGGVAKLKLKSGANSEAAAVVTGPAGTVLAGDANQFGSHFTGLLARFH